MIFLIPTSQNGNRFVREVMQIDNLEVFILSEGNTRLASVAGLPNPSFVSYLVVVGVYKPNGCFYFVVQLF